LGRTFLVDGYLGKDVLHAAFEFVDVALGAHGGL
jgi:hypothetical protein